MAAEAAHASLNVRPVEEPRVVCACGSSVDLIVPGPEWPLTCRACFIRWDVVEEATMFTYMEVGRAR